MKQEGYALIIALVSAAIILIVWYFYFWEKQWFTGLNENSSVGKEQNISEQLNNLRSDVKKIQNKRDEEIFDAMNGSK